MKALCIKETMDFYKDNEYNICPTVGGYQATDGNNKTIGFTDDTFDEHFKIEK